MPKLIEVERKAAAIGFLRADPPFQARIVQGCSVSQSTITQWINKDKLVYIDLKRPGALDEWKRFQRTMLRKYGVNLSKRDLKAIDDAIDPRAPCPLCGTEPVDEQGRTEKVPGGFGAREVSDAAPALLVERLSPGERAERMSALLLANADMLMSAAERQGGVMNKPQVDTLMTMLRLADKLETQMQERAGERQTRTDAELGELYDRVERRMESRALAWAAELIRDAGRDDGDGGVHLPAEAFTLLRERAAAMEHAGALELEAEPRFLAPQP